MNTLLSPMLFFALLCTILQLPTLSLPTAAISDSLDQSASASASVFSLPSRSVILSALLHQHHSNSNRSLQQQSRAKFSSLNEIFSQISLKLPDAKVSQSGLDLTITQIVCSNLNVQDITLDHTIQSNTSQNLNVDISGIYLSCNFRWQYKWSFFNGGGSGTASLDKVSSASLDLQFTSDDYNTQPPKDVSVQNCGPNIQIADMDFEGDGLGVIGGIISLFEGLLRDTVEDELGSTVCDELRALGDDAMDDLLIQLSGKVDEFLQPLDESLSDPLFVENTMEIPMIESAVQDGEPKSLYLNFQQLDEYTGEWINSVMDQANSFLGISGDGSSGELGINTFIRDNLLNGNGEFAIDPSLFFDNGVVFEGHDSLTETTMSIKSLKIRGFDSFQGLDVMNAIGKHTLQNKFKLGYLWIEAEMEAEMKASSKPDAVIVTNGDIAPIIERFTIDVNVTDIDIDASIFLGINTETLGNLELGSLLNTENILPCLFGAIDEAQFSGLSMTVQDIVPPRLSGFIDGGIDHLVSTAATALFDMYENVLIKAMPNFLESYARGMVNDLINDTMEDSECPKKDISDMGGYIDFRDMFYDQAESALAGGSGDGRYGNVIPWVWDIIEDQILSAETDDGLSSLNDMLIAPLTKSQSGTAGSFKVNGTFVDLNKEDVPRDIWQAFADNLRLTMSDLDISGLDTLRSPIKVLKPRSSSAHLLENHLSLGTPSKPLDASFQFGIEVGDDSSPLATHNIMDLQLRMPSIDVLATIFATIQESRFMSFPLKDVLNFSCWLSMIPVSSKSAGINVGLAMHYLDVIFDILSQTECVSCSNTWLEDLNSIVAFLDENNFITDLKSKALSIASDLLKGDWVQGLVDSQITQASQLCPHDASFGSVLSDQTNPTFKATRSMVDGILYAAFPLVQVVAVVLAKKHSNLEIASPVDIKLDAPDGANLIDLTDLSSVAAWADMALEEARSYLGARADDSQYLGITSMLQSFALDDNGLLTISIKDEGFEAGGVKLSLYNVTLVGLDSFTQFEVLEASDPNTFSNSIKLQRLGATVEMGLSVEDESSEQARMLMARGLNVNELETITVSLIFKDVDLDVSLLMAMDQDLLGELQLGSILNTNHILSCLLSTIHSIGLSEFVMDIGDIEDFSISGFISEDTNQSIQSITESIFSEYKAIVLDAMPAFTSTTIRPILHDIMQVLVGNARDDGACPEPDTSMNGVVDWRDLLLSEERALELLGQGDSPYGDLVRMLFGFLEGMMSESDENGLSKMNTLVASLTERQSSEGGDLYYPGDLFKQDLDIDLNGLNAAIELGVSDVRVTNLDSLGSPMKLLQPVKGELGVLDNTASIGAGSEALRAEFRLLIKGKGNEVEVHNDLVLGLSLKSVDMMLELLAEIEEIPFLNFPLRDVMNLQCWLATVVTPVLDKYGIRVGEQDSSIVLRNLALAVAEAQLDIECIECSSPLIMEMSTKLSSQEAIEDTTEVANMILEYISNLLGGDFVQNYLDQMLNEAAMNCPHSPSYNQNFAGLKYTEMVAVQQDEEVYGFLIAIIVVIGVSAVLAFAVSIAARYVSRRRHNRWLSTLTRAQKLDLEKMQAQEKEREKDLDGRMKSLVCSGEVPLFIRLFIPVVILGNIALFLSGHLSIGGTVSISGSFAGQPFNIDGFFEFSMAKSTIEMWKAGAKSLAIMIVIFSGVWPYSKLLTTLFIWFAPPRMVSSKRRESILIWLDVLGKWSMVDVFVLLMTLASFRLSIESPDQLSFLPQSLYSINMLVVPLWGLYANMLAQLVAQVSSHVIIHYHRKTIIAATQDQQAELNISPLDEGKIAEKLRMHSFKLDYEASSKRATVKRGVNWVLSAAMFSFLILVVIGCALPSFSIEVLGLVGLAVESGNQFEQANVLYSVFNLASMIMDQGRYLNTASDLVGLGTLASLLVITVFIVPLAQAASLLVQWFVPLTKKQRMQNTILNEILSAWQYMEVYVLSIIIAAWQLGGVSEYMINAYCGSLDGTFNTLSYYGMLREEDAQCFRVNAGVESASWVLVAASLMLYILNNFIVGASAQKNQDDDTPSDRRFYSDRWLQNKQSTVTIGLTTSDEEDGFDWSDEMKEPSVSPVRPRFTDYFFYATRHHGNHEPAPDYGVETAVLPMAEIEEE